MTIHDLFHLRDPRLFVWGLPVRKACVICRVELFVQRDRHSPFSRVP